MNALKQDVPQAAVVGGSLVSFGSGLSSQDRQDIYMSNLFAQMATRSAYEDGLVGNWFDYYRNQLRFLGWDTAKPIDLRPDRGLVMGDGAYKQISNTLGERFATPAGQALDSVRQNAKALGGFEGASLVRERGFFQLLPCVAKGAGKIEIGLYHKQFKTRKTVSRFLFWSVDDVLETSVEQMAIVTFSTVHYATYREKVANALVKHTTRLLHELEI